LWRRLRAFENMVLREIFGDKMAEVTGDWKKYTVRSFVSAYGHQIRDAMIAGKCGQKIHT
jgi:hypothetical protein